MFRAYYDVSDLINTPMSPSNHLETILEANLYTFVRTEQVKLHFKICVIKFKCTMFESCGFNAQNVKSSEIKLQEIAAITCVM